MKPFEKSGEIYKRNQGINLISFPFKDISRNAVRTSWRLSRGLMKQVQSTDLVWSHMIENQIDYV